MSITMDDLPTAVVVFEDNAALRKGKAKAVARWSKAPLGGGAGVAALGFVAGAFVPPAAGTVAAMVVGGAAVGGVAGSPVPGPGNIAGAIVGGVVGGVFGVAGVVAARRVRRGHPGSGHAGCQWMTRKQADEKNLNFGEASVIPGVVYHKHPLKNHYIPVSRFHQVLFHEKVNEAVEVFRILGPTRLQLTVKQGYGEGFVGGFGAADVASARGRTRASKSNEYVRDLQWEGQPLPTLNPMDHPGRFPWYREDKSLQSAYRARLEGGIKIKADSGKLIYADAYDVDLKLNAVIEKIGLSAGGKFIDFKRTEWIWKLTY